MHIKGTVIIIQIPKEMVLQEMLVETCAVAQDLGDEELIKIN